jgi:hypothetical protein
MTAFEEKPDVERQSNSAETEKIPSDLTAEQRPQSDAQYNVTLKTWCVVTVSLFGPLQLLLRCAC